MARYICFEGNEGMGKTTQVDLLVRELQSRGYKVLQTKEPGVGYLPATMKLREVMLSAEYTDELTPIGRELISQAIRSISLHYLTQHRHEYDFIIQDRGVYSGYAYGVACGHSPDLITFLAGMAIPQSLVKDSPDSYHKDPLRIYDDVIYLHGDIEAGLVRAGRKQEFAHGDVIEQQNREFHEHVKANFDQLSVDYGFKCISVDESTVEQVHMQVLGQLNLT